MYGQITGKIDGNSHGSLLNAYSLDKIKAMCLQALPIV